MNDLTRPEAPGPPAIPGPRTYRVDIPPVTVMERLRGDEAVAIVKSFPPRSRSAHRYLAEVIAGGFRVTQNLPRSTLDGGPPEVRRFYLEARVRGTAEGAEVQVEFRPGPRLRQLSYWVLWGASLAWLAATGVTGAKVGLVMSLFVITAPVFLHDLRQARGTREDRIELLSLMERILGPSLIGESPAEQTPYRDGHPPRGDAAVDADDDEE
ncbi:MAG: hypothetical protein R3B09_09945 [Nannocystaceae bacterium]